MKHFPLHVSILVLALTPFIAHAGGGAFEINQDCAAVGCFAGDSPGFPISITVSGSYVLTSDLLVTTPGVNAININASSIDLDLNGHKIDGGGTCSGLPVTSCSAGAGVLGISAYAGGASVGSLHVHDGTIRGFTNGAAPAAMFISDAGDGTVLERLNVLENGGSGNGAIQIYTTGSGGTVRLRDSQVARNAGYGITKPGGGTAALTIAVENSDISGNKLFGMTGFGTATYTGNRFNNNGSYAINGVSSTSALGQNTFSGNNGGGAGLQYSITNVRDMGGNVCIDHTPCP